MNVSELWNDHPRHQIKPFSELEKWKSIRGYRDTLIDVAQSKISRHQREVEMIALGTGIAKTTLTDDQLLEIYLYIQSLADLPQTFSNPDDVIFPSPP